MLDNYKKEPDKYLYKLRDDNIEPFKKGRIYYPNCHDSIEKLVKSNRNYLLDSLDSSIQIAIFRKGRVIVPSEFSYFDEETIFDWLKEATERGIEARDRGADVYNPYVFTKLPYKKIKELSNHIYNFLDCNIVNRDCYVIGQHIQDITLTKEEYIKYL